MAAVLNIDAPLMWDPACPVLLPLGPITISSIIAASIGIFIPFLIFTLFLFYYLYEMWMQNTHSPSNSNSSVDIIISNHKTALFDSNKLRQKEPMPYVFSIHTRQQSARNHISSHHPSKHDSSSRGRSKGDNIEERRFLMMQSSPRKSKHGNVCTYDNGDAFLMKTHSVNNTRYEAANDDGNDDDDDNDE